MEGQVEGLSWKLLLQSRTSPSAFEGTDARYAVYHWEGWPTSKKQPEIARLETLPREVQESHTPKL